MSPTGKFLTAASTAALVLGIAAQGLVVFADTNNPAPWHAHFFTENVEFKAGFPGDSFQFVVQYTNGGQRSWVLGLANQEARLGTGWTFGDAANPSDNTNDFSAGWSVNWLSLNRIAAQTESTVLPGTNATFTYSAKIPAGAAAGNKQIKFQPVIDGVQWLENYGAYHGFNVSTAAPPPPPPPPGGIQPSGNNPAVASVDTTAFGTARPRVCFTHSMATTDGYAINDISHFSISGGPSVIGFSSTDSTCVTLALASALTKDATFSLVVSNVADAAGFMIAPNPTTFTFTAKDDTKPTVTSISQPNTYSFIVKFSEAIAPGSASSASFAINAQAWPGTITLNSGNTSFGSTQTTGVTTIDPNTEVRLAWTPATRPGSGSQTLVIRNVTDAAGNALSTNPWPAQTVTIPANTTAPTASASFNQSSRQSANPNMFTQYLNVEWNPTVDPSSAGTASNYSLFRSDGTTPATTKCLSGDPLSVSSASLATDDESRFELRRVTLRLSALITESCSYQLKINNVQDTAGNAVPANYTVSAFSAPDATAPSVSSAKATSSQLLVVFGKDMLGSASALTPANYKSTSGSPATNTALGTAIAGASGPALTSTSDGTTVIFTFASNLPSGSYPLTILGDKDAAGNPITTGVKDPAGNTLITVTVTVTFQDTQPPTLLGAALGPGAGSGVTCTTAQCFNVTYSEPVRASADANSADNGTNYSVNNGAFGSLCASGSLVMTANSTGTNYTLNCSGGAGLWSTTPGSNVVQVRNVADIAGNVIFPNPSSRGF